jgi:hypothetical protein
LTEIDLIRKFNSSQHQWKKKASFQVIALEKKIELLLERYNREINNEKRLTQISDINN